MISSPMLLSLSTVFALVGLALVCIGGFSDNWLEYQVNRNKIFDAINHDQNLSAQINENVSKKPIYFSRTVGLIHICFPENVPTEIGSFSKFGSLCIVNSDYFPGKTAYDRYTSIQKQRLMLMRSQVVSYGVGIAMILISLIVGIISCYKRSAKYTCATAFVLTFAIFSLVLSLVLWHCVYYQEKYLLTMQPFYQSWDLFLKKATEINFGWSYVLACVGIAFCVTAAFFLFCSSKAIQNEEEQIYKSKHAAFYQQYYDKSLVPITYGTPYSNSAYDIYPPPPPPAVYYGTHPAYGLSNYYGYHTYN